MLYDIVIPTTNKDLKTLEQCINQCKTHLKFRRIIIISKEKYTDSAEWFNEKYYQFNIEDLKEYLGDHHRLGWYLQQLLKLYTFFTISNINIRFRYISFKRNYVF